MRVHAATSRYALIEGDVAAVCTQLPAGHFDAVLCDPPYGLAFMGKRWDYQVPSVQIWTEVLRCLKPGAPILAFGGTRTYHRLVVNLEDAGAEIRDQLSWLYGSGFPKSLDASKALDAMAGAKREVLGPSPHARPSDGQAFACHGTKTHPPLSAPTTDAAKDWQGYGTALKPAVEPIVLARKPLEGTLAQNITKHGCGPLAIDATRIGYANEADQAKMAAGVEAIRERGGVIEGSWKNSSDLSGANPASSLGRWPANVILDEAAGAMLDEQSGTLHTHRGRVTKEHLGMGFHGGAGSEREVHAGSGGASRFFYCAKAGKGEREAGLDALPMRAAHEVVEREEGSAGLDNPRAGAGRSSGRRNFHPTVKPLSLLRYLARLIKPAGTSRILVPFSGSGSEVVSCLLEGWDEVVGIEREADYLPIAEARILHHLAGYTKR